MRKTIVISLDGPVVKPFANNIRRYIAGSGKNIFDTAVTRVSYELGYRNGHTAKLAKFLSDDIRYGLFDAKTPANRDAIRMLMRTNDVYIMSNVGEKYKPEIVRELAAGGIGGVSLIALNPGRSVVGALRDIIRANPADIVVVDSDMRRLNRVRAANMVPVMVNGDIAKLSPAHMAGMMAYKDLASFAADMSVHGR